MKPIDTLEFVVDSIVCEAVVPPDVLKKFTMISKKIGVVANPILKKYDLSGLKPAKPFVRYDKRKFVWLCEMESDYVGVLGAMPDIEEHLDKMLIKEEAKIDALVRKIIKGAETLLLINYDRGSKVGFSLNIMVADSDIQTLG